MKFSRNPKSGVLEAYTDDGEFIGIISSFGDRMKKPEELPFDEPPNPDDDFEDDN